MTTPSNPDELLRFMSGIEKAFAEFKGDHHVGISMSLEQGTAIAADLRERVESRRHQQADRQEPEGSRGDVGQRCERVLQD